MYTAYGDDSADETKQRVFAIAGLFGNENDWNVFRDKWRIRTGGKIFHAKDCDSDKKDYAHADHAENKSLYADLAKIIADSPLIGEGIALSLPDYNEAVAPYSNKEPYYLGFIQIALRLAKKSSFCIPQDKIEFIFDRNHEIEYNAGAIYDRIMNNPDNAATTTLMSDKVSFASREEIGIQAADLIAREAMKWLDNEIGPVQRHIRMSTKALLANKRIVFRSFRRDWFEKFVEGSVKNKDPRYVPYPKEDYLEWLSRKRLQDTVPNQIRYEAGRDKTKKSK